MIVPGDTDAALSFAVDSAFTHRHAQPARAPHRARFLVSIGQRDVVVVVSEIVWIRADGYCATLVARDRKEYLVRMSLDRLEAELDPDGFIRIHRSAIVNISEVCGLERVGGRSLVAVLRHGTRLPISRSRRDIVIRALGGV